MCSRVVTVDTAAEDGDRRTGLESTAVSSRVDAAGETGDDHDARGGELAREPLRDRRAVGRARAGADDRNSRTVVEVGRIVGAHEEPGRRIVDQP